MTNETVDTRGKLKLFWWVFALRGGFSLLFAALLSIACGLLGSIFLDPILIVYLSLLLGFFVFGNGLIFGVAAAFSAEHRLPLWKQLASESAFAIALGAYIAASLVMTAHSLALLAGLHAVGVGCFQIALAFKLGHDRTCRSLLALGGTLSLVAGFAFLTHTGLPLQSTTLWLSAFEFAYGSITIIFAWRLKRLDSPAVTTLQPLPSPTTLTREHQPSAAIL